jgi:hypothetical protein
MAKEPHLTERERADLVAYLDGELGGEAARALEAKLNLSPEARAEADSLKRTWDLLDFLPRAEPSPRFTERTLSRLSPVSAVRPGALAVPAWHRWAGGALWAVAVVAAFVAGWAGYNLLAGREPGENRRPQAAGEDPETRDQKFLDRLPARVREEVQRLPAEQRPARLAQLRREEEQQRGEWLRHARQQPNPWAAAPPTRAPSHLNELPPEVQTFVKEVLAPRLTAEEKENLQNADKKGEGLPRVLVELTERRLSLPPLPPPRGPILHYKDLPQEAKRHAPRLTLEKTMKWEPLKAREGRWPDFALAFVEVVPAGQRYNLPPLGAARPSDFSPEVQAVIDKLRQLSPPEGEELHKAEGHWPRYPRLLLELARKHHLAVPGMTLPGPRELWEHRN